MRKQTAFLVVVFALCALALQAADLSIDMQVNVAAADDANNYLSYTGKAGSASKDGFDAKTGASTLKSTAMLNAYRTDVQGGKTLPGGLRSLLLYPVAGNPTRVDDNLSAVKNSDGSILVRYVHRGTAYELLTDKAGKFSLPGSVKTRKIGYIAGHDPQVISSDFSSDGKASGVDWKKVWDASIAESAIAGTANKTGKIAMDEANSTWYVWSGALQFSLDKNILKIKGDLDVKKK